MRKLAFIMIGLVLAASLSATGTQEGGTGPIKVSFWYSYGGTNRTVTEKLIEQYNQSQSEYVIEGTFQGGYYEALGKYRAAIASGTAPAMIHTVPAVLPELYEAGVVENLEPYANEKNPVNLDDFTDALAQDGQFDYMGKDVYLFAMPFNRSTPIMYTNGDMLSQKGLRPPQTWKELNTAAEKLTVKNTDGTVDTYGFEVPVDWWFWLAKVYQAGGSLLSPDGQRPAFKEAGIEALQDWKSMVDARIMKRPPGKDYNAWEVTNTDFINEKAGIIWTSTAFLTYLTENTSFNMECAFLPRKEKYALPTGGTSLIITKSADQREKDGGWAFVKWLTDVPQTIFWSQNTGYMVVRDSAREDPSMREFLSENPNFQVSYDQLQYAFPLPFSPVVNDLNRQIITPNLVVPILGQKSVREMMEQAEDEAVRLISTK